MAAAIQHEMSNLFTMLAMSMASPNSTRRWDTVANIAVVRLAQLPWETYVRQGFQYAINKVLNQLKGRLLSRAASSPPASDVNPGSADDAETRVLTLTREWNGAMDVDWVDAIIWYLVHRKNVVKDAVYIGNTMIPSCLPEGTEILPGITCTMTLTVKNSGTTNSSRQLFPSASTTITLKSKTLTIDAMKRAINETCVAEMQAAQNDKLGTHTWIFKNRPGLRGPKMARLFTTRTFANVFLPAATKDLLLERVGFFMNRPDWYTKNGIPHTLGILLYGPPGSGKTSTIKAMAKYMKRHIVEVNLRSMCSSTLESLLTAGSILTDNKGTVHVPIEKRLYVFEDVDCMTPAVLRRELQTPPSKDDTRDPYAQKPLSLSDILNVLDGVVETPGRVMIWTTNRPDVLDPALVRPGRIDACIRIGEIDAHACGDMIGALCEVDQAPLRAKLTEAVPAETWKATSVTPAMVSRAIIDAGLDANKAMDAVLAMLKHQQQQS